MKKMVMILALLPVVAGAQKSGIKDLFPNTPTPFVTDAAGILKPSDITALNDKARGVQGATGGDIAVATLPTIGDYQPYEVALEIGRVWKVGGKADIGQDKRNLGVVILLVPRTKEHKGSCYIATGNGAEGVITDARAGDICRNAIPRLKAGDYAGGLMFMMNEIGPIFESTVHPPRPGPPDEPTNWGFIALIGAVLGAITSLIGVIVHLNNKAKERARIAREKKERERQAAEHAKWVEQDRERQRLAAIAQKKRDAEEAERRRIAAEKEAARWAALTPDQQAAELEAKRLVEIERRKREAELAALAAIELKKRRDREAKEAEERRKREEEEEEEEERRRHRSSYDYGSSSSTSYDFGSSSSDSSDSFGGGGGFSGGGGAPISKLTNPCRELVMMNEIEMDEDVKVESGNDRLRMLATSANSDLHFCELTRNDQPIPFIVENASLYPEIKWLSGLVNRQRFIAGGCFRDIFLEQKDKIRDIDLWHLSKPDWEHTVRQFDRSSDFERKYETDNAVGYVHKPTGMVVEAIGRSFGTPDTILKEFDFSVAKFALFMDADGALKTSRHVQYFHDLQRRELSLHRDYEFHPDRLFNRVIKYARYGFVPDWSLKQRLFQGIKAMEEFNE